MLFNKLLCFFTRHSFTKWKYCFYHSFISWKPSGQLWHLVCVSQRGHTGTRQWGCWDTHLVQCFHMGTLVTSCMRNTWKLASLLHVGMANLSSSIPKQVCRLCHCSLLDSALQGIVSLCLEAELPRPTSCLSWRTAVAAQLWRGCVAFDIQMLFLKLAGTTSRVHLIIGIG